MIDTGDLRKGVTIEVDGTIYQLIDFQHIKIGRGSAQVRMKLRDIRGGHTIEKTVQSGERFTRAELEKRSVQYLYDEDSLYYVMDTESYEQFPISKTQIDEALPFLVENTIFEIVFYQDDPVGVELPTTVTLKITETAPSFRGDTANAGTKPATLETGLVVNVPMFVENGTAIVVDTRTSEYLERA
ncbi:MAG: elongation factor P [Dehalococcoidia bacterium]|jgi:elongation factor P|nr:elongation factor P [Dehalococcoidia bacterium]